ncbi:MAG: 7-cyano-7-deazaguanine synthase QueC [Lysobacterales bacterium]
MKTRIDPVTPPRAVVLLSGGMDSAVTLAIARERGYVCHALSLAYGQRHSVELDAARSVALILGAIEHKVLALDLRAFGGSALTADIAVPDHEVAMPVSNEVHAAGGEAVSTSAVSAASQKATEHIPITYVPARNTIMLSLALGWAEVLDASAIFLGVNAVDYSGYPDCRPQFIAAFEQLAALATRAGVEGHGVAIEAPLLSMSKAEIVSEGLRLGVDFAATVTCYQADTSGHACGRCDACALRREGFAAAGVADPTRYAKK